MDNPPPTQPTPADAAQSLDFRLFGIGSAGIAVAERLVSGGFPAAAVVAVDTQAIAHSCAAEQVRLEARDVQGRSAAEDERSQLLAEESRAKLKSLCEGVKKVLIVAGLGGGTGTGISPVLARTARDAGALTLAFVMTPFDCEGSRRQSVAQAGLDELKEAVDGVLCLPNQKVTKIIDEHTNVLDAFKSACELLADGVLGIWRLLSHKGFIEIHVADLCEVLRGRHTDCVFAVAQAAGATRSRDVLERLMAHPMLDGGEALGDSDAMLVNLTGGPDLTMTEVNRVMEELGRKCASAQIIMGAAIDQSFGEQLAVTMIVARKPAELAGREITPRPAIDGLEAQLMDRGPVARPGSRFVPPPPVLPPEQMRRMLDEQRTGASGPRKARPKMRQGQLPLEIVSKGRFDKSEPTIYKGEDLDVPTYIRRGVSLN